MWAPLNPERSGMAILKSAGRGSSIGARAAMFGEGRIPLVCGGKKNFGPAVYVGPRPASRASLVSAATVAVLTSACAPVAAQIAGEEGGAWESQLSSRSGLTCEH